MVTKQIIEKLEQGTIPWQKPFLNSSAVNWKTQKEYRGINTLLLNAGEYATFNQIKEAGGKVKKGEKSSIVVFWKMLEVKNKDTGMEEQIPMLRYYRVFKVGEQTEDIKPKRKTETFSHNTIESAEAIIKNFKDKPKITFANNAAYYQPDLDFVNVPPKTSFPKIHDYYSVLFHELVHSTGHEKRLNREGIAKFDKFGSKQYSREELIAEIGASMLCGVAGIEDRTIDNSASYIKSWLSALNNDSTLIIKASQQAQKASDFMQGITFEKKKLQTNK